MKKDLKWVATMIILATLWSSCYRRASCDCEKATGCSTVMAYSGGGATLVAQLVLCADSNLPADVTYSQELKAFEEQYRNYKIVKLDTALKREMVNNLKFKEQGPYKSNGFRCVCYK